MTHVERRGNRWVGDRAAVALFLGRSVNTIRKHCTPIDRTPNGRPLYDMQACAAALAKAPARDNRRRWRKTMQVEIIVKRDDLPDVHVVWDDSQRDGNQSLTGGLDELLVIADRDVRRACDLPWHYMNAFEYLARLPYRLEHLPGWTPDQGKRPMSLTEIVEQVEAVLPRYSVGAPAAQSSNLPEPRYPGPVNRNS